MIGSAEKLEDGDIMNDWHELSDDGAISDVEISSSRNASAGRWRRKREQQVRRRAARAPPPGAAFLFLLHSKVVFGLF